MRRTGKAFILALAACACIGATRPPTPAPVPTLIAPVFSPIDQMSWLVGGLWVAQTDQGNIHRIETRYEWTANHAFIRFSTRFVLGSGPQDRYDGNIFYDPDSKHLMMWYIDNLGAVTHGPIELRGALWAFTFSQPDANGHPVNFRVEVNKTANDRYTWNAFQQSGASWDAFLSLNFIRQAG